jgi:hypothetical protein
VFADDKAIVYCGLVPHQGAGDSNGQSFKHPAFGTFPLDAVGCWTL